MWDLSFLTKDESWSPCFERQSLNHWTTREAPRLHILLRLFDKNLLTPLLKVSGPPDSIWIYFYQDTMGTSDRWPSIFGPRFALLCLKYNRASWTYNNVHTFKMSNKAVICIYLWNHHQSQDTEDIYHPPEFSRALCHVSFLPLTTLGKHSSAFCLHSLQQVESCHMQSCFWSRFFSSA